jgi:hypothetical protein
VYYDDRIKETTTTTGTGNITLAGAVAQFAAFSSYITVGHQFDYAIVGQSGTEWETGRGSLSGASTLVREAVYGSSNSNALVNFSSGTKDVFVTLGGATMTFNRAAGSIAAYNGFGGF